MSFAPKQTLRTALVFAICIATLTNHSLAQFKSEVTSDSFDKVSDATVLMAPTPFLFGSGQSAYNSNGNPSCQTLNGLDNNDPGNPPTDANFAHMTTNWEFKIDFGSPNGTFPIVNTRIPTIVSGGMTENSAYSISIPSSGNNTINSWSLNWSAPLDRIVSAVIVKGGPNGANVYTYPNLSLGDAGPFMTPGGFEISHVTFCFEPFAGPSAAPVSIAGRALTQNGYGVSGARIEILNLATGETMTATTNPFGYYAFKGVSSEVTYIVTASHKRHQFIDSQRTLTLNEDLVGLDFVSAW